MILFIVLVILSSLSWFLWINLFAKDLSNNINKKIFEKPKKKLSLNEDDIVPFSAEAIIIGTFFDRDKKYAAICPFIGGKIISIPHVVSVTDDNTLSWGQRDITQGVREKATKIYKEYKKLNKERFQ